MTVPEIYDLLVPLLTVIKDKKEYKVKEITDEVIDLINLSDEDKNIKLPNNESLIEFRISSANTYLRKAELVESNRFMYYNITDNGLNILQTNPNGISEEDLMEIPSFREFKKVFKNEDNESNKNNNKNNKNSDNEFNFNEIQSPQDALRTTLEKQMEEVRKEITDDLLKENKVKYFQPKEKTEANETYEIKSRRNEIDKNKSRVFNINSQNNKNNKNNNYPNPKKDKENSRINIKQKEENIKKDLKSSKKLKYIIYKEFSPADELLKYVELFERGYLTQEEFNKKKKELLEYKKLL